MSTADNILSSQGPVALSFSGGGGRAAGFHLGVLSYLDRLDVLKEVSTLSTVSGGTVIGAKYALSLKMAPDGEDLHTTFRKFFNDFYSFALGADLIHRALTQMTEKPPLTPSGCRTMVTAMANVYDQDPRLMNGARFGIFWDDKPIHLKNIIFNATECKTGHPFRFQKLEKGDFIGSFDLWLDVEQIKQARLADIVASSMDIPIALEPILFPQNFVWPEDKPDLWRQIQFYLKNNFGIDTLALMDGGCVDNQGIESVMLATNTKDGAPYQSDADPEKIANWYYSWMPREADLGLYIISDVPLLSDIYTPDITAAPRGKIRVGSLQTWWWVLFLTSLNHILTVGTFAYRARNSVSAIDFLFLYVIPLMSTSAVFCSLIAIRHELKKLLLAASAQAPKLWRYAKLLTIKEVEYLLRTRLASAWALTNSIFLDRVRRLTYYAAYATKLQGPSTSSTGDNAMASRLAPCEIYTLTHLHPELPPWLQPTPEMQQIAMQASTLQTALWLTKEQLDNLVMCGQMTMCFVMLTYLLKYPPGQNPAIDKLVAQARSDWETLKKDCGSFLPQAAQPKPAATA